jgi:bifunctional non-homologous end joining protein LigD
VYVPLNSRVGFGETKAFARNVAEVLASRLPDRVVARADKRLRRGRVLVDWGQRTRSGAWTSTATCSRRCSSSSSACLSRGGR